MGVVEEVAGSQSFPCEKGREWEQFRCSSENPRLLHGPACHPARARCAAAPRAATALAGISGMA